LATPNLIAAIPLRTTLAAPMIAQRLSDDVRRKQLICKENRGNSSPSISLLAARGF